MFGIAPSSSLLSGESRERSQHTLEYHGEECWTEQGHRVLHASNDEAIRNMLNSDLHDPALWVGSVMLVKHTHEDDDY